MKRLAKYILRGATILSLLLMLAFIGLWAWSYQEASALVFHLSPDGDFRRPCEVIAYRGKLVAIRARLVREYDSEEGGAIGPRELWIRAWLFRDAEARGWLTEPPPVAQSVADMLDPLMEDEFGGIRWIAQEGDFGIGTLRAVIVPIAWPAGALAVLPGIWGLIFVIARLRQKSRAANPTTPGA